MGFSMREVDSRRTKMSKEWSKGSKLQKNEPNDSVHNPGLAYFRFNIHNSSLNQGQQQAFQGSANCEKKITQNSSKIEKFVKD
jgi:hypothetical protein